MVLLSELFTSIQGETTLSGRVCSFVRMAGCNLRCTWCDTAYARDGGTPWCVEKIIREVAGGPGLVAVTGGEPLLQEETPDLVKGLIERGHEVIVETNGSLPIDVIDRRAFCMVDFKPPSSGETDRMDWRNISLLSAGDEVKITVSDREDFAWAAGIIRSYPELSGFCINVTPGYDLCTPQQLAEWIIEEGLDVRLNMQLHKILWPHEPRRR